MNMHIILIYKMQRIFPNAFLVRHAYNLSILVLMKYQLSMHADSGTCIYACMTDCIVERERAVSTPWGEEGNGRTKHLVYDIKALYIIMTIHINMHHRSKVYVLFVLSYL